MIKKQFRVPESMINCLLAIYLVYNIPIVPHYISTVLFVFPTALLLLCLVAYGSVPQNAGAKFFITSFLFLLLLLVDEMFIEGNIVYYLWNVLLKYTPLVAGYLIIEHKLQKTARTFLVMTLLTYILTCITTYIALQTYPNASRDLASGTNAGFFGRMNVGGFSFIYSLAITHPMFVYYLRKKGHPILSVLVTLLFTGCIIAARYTIALIVFAVSLLCYLIPAKESKKLNKSFIVIILVCFLIAFMLAPTLLEHLAEQELFGGFSKNLLDISNMLRGENVQESNTKVRQMKYSMSWEAFLQHPLLGGMLAYRGSITNVSGGHSFFLDIMGRWGLIGISIVLATVWRIIKWYKSLFAGSYALYYALFCLTLSLVVAALNSAFWFFELGMIIPLFAQSAMQYTQNENRRPLFGIRIRWR